MSLRVFSNDIDLKVMVSSTGPSHIVINNTPVLNLNALFGDSFRVMSVIEAGDSSYLSLIQYNNWMMAAVVEIPKSTMFASCVTSIVTHEELPMSTITFDPKTRKIYVGSYDKTVKVLEANKRFKTVYNFTDVVEFIHYFTEIDTLVVCTDSRIYRCNGDNVTTLLHFKNYNSRKFAASRSSPTIAIADYESTITVRIDDESDKTEMHGLEMINYIPYFDKRDCVCYIFIGGR